MSMNISLVSLVFVLLITGCISAAPVNPQPFKLRPIEKGAFSAVEQPTKAIIKDEDSWGKFWKQHTTNATKPKIDFSKEMVVVITMGRQRSGGFSIEIADVREIDGRLRVSFKQKTPPPGSFSIQTLTSPFHIVAVPRSSQKPEFVELKTAAE
jgi:hypothetical protein